ncbi:META domain-containing protein [Nocardioides euryhalodurans]|uniref:META domain-containing protein n=1 Tax=Nocardioides euryhalodurans TaxID=2518370 RepID=UPI0014202D70
MPPDAGARPGLTLEDTRWLLTDIAENTDQASSVTAVPAGVRSTLVLTGGRVAAFLGCNQARGDAEVVRDRIELGPLMTTRMACPGPEGEVEQQVSTVLEGSVPWSITGDRLTLGEGALQLIYTAGS